MEAVRSGFSSVQQQVEGLGKVLNQNMQAVQGGFYKNDIWLECFKLVLEDLVNNEVATATAEGGLRESIDWESYWKTANANINAAMKPVEPVVETAGKIIATGEETGDIVFGGDSA